MIQPLFELVEYTHRSVFLTGKAGTGKTTFLNELVKKSRKKHIVVAPTGIAAINAGGVTIHSMFGLPLRTFIPTLERIDGSLGNNIADLISHFKYRKDKLKLLREVELIIIDEVSMLRADVLDMMDFSLRHIRRNPQKFGGVQMLFIGDLHQLPPVVRDESFLLEYYDSPFFFSAKALQDYDMVTLELTKVYRQSDQYFLDILNNIREGNIHGIDFDLLNSRYDRDFEPKEQAFVYLTSHNRMANDINKEKLQKLEGKSHFYEASIVGDFKESQYPNEPILELKPGTQVMFIRNDATQEKRYYNGKLAEVVRCNNDEIYVLIDGSNQEYKLKKEIWENKKYSLDSEKNIKEEVLGSFEQYPIRLAWAVTIHKSQGLTFDRVIIDAGKSFASGQVYVALSRCRTLEGIVLKSKITPDIIFKDRRVTEFQDETNANDRVQDIINAEKYDYAVSKVLNRTQCSWLSDEVESWYTVAQDSKKLAQQKVRPFYLTLKSEAENINAIEEKFQKVMASKLRKFVAGAESWDDIEQKIKGGVLFFFNNVKDKIYQPLQDHYAETKGTAGMKGYNEHLRTFLDDLQDYLDNLQSATLFDKPLFVQEQKTDLTANITKVPTHILTWRLFQEGKSINEIARERGILETTVIGHFTKFAQAGTLTAEELQRIVHPEKIEIFQKLSQLKTFDNLNAWKAALPDDFEYGEIRLLWTYFCPPED